VRKLLSVVLTLSFAAPVWCADLGAQFELQSSVGNAAGMMDGSGKLPAFNPGAASSAAEDAPPSEPPAKKGLLARAKDAAGAVRNFLVRNPVEASFAVSIPVTFLLGPTAGMIAGTATYLLLLRQKKSPF